jgi:hypothetical protein
MEKEFYEAGKNYKYEIIEDKYKNYIFLRGIFEKFGKISKRNLINSKLYCTIEIFNDEENNLSEFLNFFHLNVPNNKYIFKELDERDTIEFLTKLYKDSDARYRDGKFYQLYLEWISFSTFIIPRVEIKIKNKKAIKDKNLWIIKEYKKINTMSLIYDTGLIIKPDFGYRIKIIPNNDVILKGYMIMMYDENEDEKTFKIVLIKTTKEVKKIELPFCCCKMIIEKDLYFEIS